MFSKFRKIRSRSANLHYNPPAYAATAPQIGHFGLSGPILRPFQVFSHFFCMFLCSFTKPFQSTMKFWFSILHHKPPSIQLQGRKSAILAFRDPFFGHFKYFHIFSACFYVLSPNRSNPQWNFSFQFCTTSHPVCSCGAANPPFWPFGTRSSAISSHLALFLHAHSPLY